MGIRWWWIGIDRGSLQGHQHEIVESVQQDMRQKYDKNAVSWRIKSSSQHMQAPEGCSPQRTDSGSGEVYVTSLCYLPWEVSHFVYFPRGVDLPAGLVWF